MGRATGKMLLLLLLQLSALTHSGFAFKNVSLSVSSLKTPLEGEGPYVVQRQLEMNWKPELDADWLGLYSVTPPQKATEVSGAGLLVRINPSDYPSGFYRTNVSFPRQPFPKGWNRGTEEKRIPGDACMPFWIAAYKNNELVHIDCIKIRPTWMGDHREKLGTLALADLFIPGTHNSATYTRRLMESDDVIGRYILTQDTEVWGQLVYGIRCLDFQVRHYPSSRAAPGPRNDDRFRKVVNVDVVTKVLGEIKEYLKEATSEIVILDIHEFPPGFGSHASDHRKLVTFLKSTLEEFILPFSSVSYNSTLAEVWKTGRNVIVTYNHPETVKEYGWLWDPVPHLWTEIQSPEDLKEFLQQCVDDAKTSNKTSFWAAMAALKPTPIDYMFGGAASLRELASSVNRNLSKWFQNGWWKYTNIVNTEFFLGNNLIDVAVKACLKKADDAFQAALEED